MPIKNRAIGKPGESGKISRKPNRWKVKFNHTSLNMVELQIFKGMTGAEWLESGLEQDTIITHVSSSLSGNKDVIVIPLINYATVEFDYGGIEFGFHYGFSDFSVSSTQKRKSISNNCFRDSLTWRPNFRAAYNISQAISASFDVIRNVDSVNSRCGGTRVDAEFIVQVLNPDIDFMVNSTAGTYDYISIEPFYMSEYTGH